MRYRKSLVYQHTQQINRLHKVLETANIKLTSVVTDMWGKSGQSMINAIIQGGSDAQTRSRVSTGNACRGKLPQLQAALEGRIQPHHREWFQHILPHLRFSVSSLSSSHRQNQSDRGGLPYRRRELLAYDHQAYSLSGARSELL